MGDTVLPAAADNKKTVIATKAVARALPRSRNVAAPMAPTVRATPETTILPEMSTIELPAHLRNDSPCTDGMLPGVRVKSRAISLDCGACQEAGPLARDHVGQALQMWMSPG